MKKLSFLLLGAIFFSTLFVSCDDDVIEPTPEATTVVDIALSDANFSILVDALTAAGLVSTLDDASAEFTVFAPTNAAFVQLLADLGYASLGDVPVSALTDILLFHVIGGEVRSGDLATGYAKTLNTQGPGGTSPDLRIVVDGGVTLNGGSMVTTADIDADNGVVHVIDKVMVPPTVVDLALSNSAFSSLVAALTAGDNTTDFVGTLSGSGPFTVFAPTDAAFAQLLVDLELDELADIPVAVRDAVLKYHVVAGANVKAADLTDEQVVNTFLSGASFTIDLDNGAQIKTSSGQTVDIIITDVQGTNGVVHVINKVLLPQS